MPARLRSLLLTALLAVVMGVGILAPFGVSAGIFGGAGEGLTTIEIAVFGRPLNADALDSVVGQIITAALSLVGVIFFGLMVYAGYLWMTARGETDQVDKAKKTLIAATIGIAITLAAYAISTFVIARLVAAGGLQ